MIDKRVALLLAAGSAFGVAAVAPHVQPAATRGRLEKIAVAHQLGPVSYRDPVGAISPDGRWLAYSEGRRVHVVPTAAGPASEYRAGDVQVRSLTWTADSRTIVTDGDPAAGWTTYTIGTGRRAALWEGRTITAHGADGGTVTARVSDLRQLAWSPDGKRAAAVVFASDGQQLWTIAADGTSAVMTRARGRIASPVWTARGELVCLMTSDGRTRVTRPCGETPIRVEPEQDWYGPLAVSPDDRTLYLSAATAAGTVDLWSVPLAGGAATRVVTNPRDAYAPSVAADGTVVFKVQNYRTTVAVAPATPGDATRLLTSFQSETPSWDPTGRWLGITYGTWRRVPDDAKYPDIAQDAGIISADAASPASAPAQVVHDSPSEDQSLCWSPNGRWIVFHSHKDQSDDLWLRRASGDPTARRITPFGRGFETGWPRWSRDGKSVVFTAASRTTHRPAAYVVDVDQDTGTVAGDPREVALRGTPMDIMHAEWLPGTRRIAAIAREAAGRHVIFTADRDGGDIVVVHRFETEHDVPGLGVSPDGKEVAFIAPAADGRFQVFRMPVAGGSPVQVTRDASNKTQPSWSPDGARIAFTVWTYDAEFWRLR